MSFRWRWLNKSPSAFREPLPLDPPAPPRPAGGFWARAAYTRLNDWFKPAPLPTLDVRKIIYDAALPAPLPGLIYLAVRRPRRNRPRRLALAHELAVVFSASLAAGESPEQIAARFREQERRGDFVPRPKSPVRVAADLPERLVRWIERLVEQASVQPVFAARAAGELAEQSAARLAAGQSVEQLIGQFGSAEPAARLLRLTRLPAAVWLPAPLREVLDKALRRARLWPGERRDVAHELTDHFLNGLAVGQSPEQLVAGFGDPLQAAQLIRRAKLRNRPLPYRVVRHSAQCLAATVGLLLFVYGCLFLRYLSGRPTIAHNYLADINRQQQSVSPNDRAWPLYREALLKLPREKFRDWDSLSFDSDRDESWPATVSYLEEQHETLALIRKAASKSSFGFIFGDPANREFLQKLGPGADAHGESPERYNPVLIECLIPQHQEIRFLAWLLAADARRAIVRDDSTAFVADVTSLVGIAEQNREAAPFLVVKLISLATYHTALHVTAIALAEQPELLSDDQWKQLAHVLAAYSGGDLRVHLDGERQMISDYLQRTFSDDGRGDGRLTPQGFIRLCRDFGAFSDDRPLASDWQKWSALLGPLMSAETPGRKELTRLADRLVDALESEYGRPLWGWQASRVGREVRELSSSRLGRMRHFPIVEFLPGSLPASAPPQLAAEVHAQKRDAVLAAIALELYRRRHAAWPPTLKELTPGLLPAVPLDRFTGNPLRYRLVNGRPLLYSCGSDGDDDGGRMPARGNQVAREWSPEAKLDAETITSAWAAAHDGDWILWPPVKEAAP